MNFKIESVELGTYTLDGLPYSVLSTIITLKRKRRKYLFKDKDQFRDDVEKWIKGMGIDDKFYSIFRNYGETERTGVIILSDLKKD